MHILSKQALKFRNGAETFIAMGGGNIQHAPDWISATSLFKAAVQKQVLFVMDQKPLLAKPEPVIVQPVVAPVVEVEPEPELEPEPSHGFDLAELNDKSIAEVKTLIESGSLDPHLGIIADQAAKAGVRNAAMARLKEIEG